MSNLDDAKKRLEQAFARIEAVAGSHAGSAEERARLASEVDLLRAENASLTARGDDVSTRLDAAIGRIKGLLDQPDEG